VESIWGLKTNEVPRDLLKPLRIQMLISNNSARFAREHRVRMVEKRGERN
jgi:hypothetical protein